MRTIPMKTIHVIGVSAVVTLLALTARRVEAQDYWVVINNLQESFTVYVWPQNDPNAVRWKEIPPGQKREIRLGPDDHEIQAVSQGGYVYVMEPMQLKNEGETKLKTLLTPKGKKNGRTYYQYMNQNGFNEGNGSSMVKDISRSRWQTTYATPGGNSVTTELVFSGDTGSYYNQHGKMTGITYRWRDGKLVVRGTWQFDNSKPSPFEFYIDENNPDQFSSSPDGGKSKWDGVRKQND